MNTTDHPSEDEADRAIAASERDPSTVEFFDHLALCRYCRARLGPTLLLVEGQRRRAGAPARISMGRAYAVAGGLALVGLILALRRGSDVSVRPPTPNESPPAPTVAGVLHEVRYRIDERSAAAHGATTEMLSADGLRRTGGEIRSGEMTLKWSTTEFVGRRGLKP